MEAGNPSDEELWEACRKLPSDWEPYGERRWHGRRESRPDCTTCKWFVELFRTWPEWGVCVNPESERAGLLTYGEQGCWQHEAEKERRYQATRPARCDFIRGFEKFLRERAADFIRKEVRKTNDPFPDGEPSARTPENIRETPFFVVVRRLLRHADEDFRRQAIGEMAARARSVAEDISEIRLPENVWELEEEFWGRVDAAIHEALEGRGAETDREEA